MHDPGNVITQVYYQIRKSDYKRHVGKMNHMFSWTKKSYIEQGP